LGKKLYVNAFIALYAADKFEIPGSGEGGGRGGGHQGEGGTGVAGDLPELGGSGGKKTSTMKRD